jgi:putative CRISPR-associated protein (TIGR02619 family)
LRAKKNLTPEEALRRHKAVADFLHADPCKASAEINSLESRTGFLSRGAAGLAVTLVFTKTTMGKCVASLLEKELKARKVAVHKVPVRGVEAPARDLEPGFASREATEALADLRQRVADHILRLQRATPSLRVELNATGGYKAECCVLYELGRTLRLPVYYLHETFKVAVELP